MFKKSKKILSTICFVLLILSNGCAPKNGFHDEGSNTYYYRDGEKLYGWIKVDNDWYYSEVEGYEGILKSTILHDTSVDSYYYLDSNGKMVTDKIINGMYFGPDGKQVFNSMIEKDGARYQIDVNGNVKTLPIYTFKSDMGMPINIYMKQKLPLKVHWNSGSGLVLVGTIEEVEFNVTRNYFIIQTIATCGERFIGGYYGDIDCILSSTDSKGVTTSGKAQDGFSGINSGEKTYLNFKFYRDSFPLSGGDVYVRFEGRP